MTTTFERPWGTYSVLHGTDTSGVKVKIITVNPKSRLSLQSHNYRREIWTTIMGSPTVIINDREFTLSLGSTTTIEVGEKHRLVNDTDEQVQILEIQLGGYLGEDDIVRYQDDYSRA